MFNGWLRSYSANCWVFFASFGDFCFAFVISLFALIYREVIQHMRVQELDFASRTAKSLPPIAPGLLRLFSVIGRTEKETPPKVLMFIWGHLQQILLHLWRAWRVQPAFKYLTTHPCRVGSQSSTLSIFILFINIYLLNNGPHLTHEGLILKATNSYFYSFVSLYLFPSLFKTYETVALINSLSHL